MSFADLLRMDQELLQASADNLSPALFKCFTIILCGYVAGRMNIVSQTESKGLATFVGTFALPSVIFSSLAQLNFAQVNWIFLLAILLAKGLVFFSVILVTLSVTKPACLGRAGLFAIFCTQSNDFALGYPIIVAIYNNSHPEYASYLYLMAPISLAILNPVSFVLMEIGKQRSANLTSELLPKSKCEKVKMFWKTVKGIACNPILVMTVLGIIGNLVFKHDLPVYISGLLQVLGDSFPAAALFLLGLRMVGQFHRLKGPALILPAVFLIVKLLVLPIVMREFVSGLSAGSNASETLTLSTYAFLYGTIPTAPAVFVFSNSYQLEVDLIASSMVLCTFVSAPLMFVSAKMIVITKDFADQLQKFGFDLSIFAAIASLWVIIVFSMTKKYRRIPHRLTSCLVATQLVLAISVIWGGLLPNDFPSWQRVFQQSFLLFSMYSCRLWTAMLAIALLFMQSRGPCFVVTIWPVLCFVSWGVPAVIISVLLVMKGHTKNLNGKISDAIRLCLVMFCLTVAAGALLIYIRYRRRNSQYNTLTAEVAGGSGENGNLQSNGSINGNEATLLIDNQEETSHSNSLSPNGGCYGAIASPSPSTSPNTCCTNNPNCNSSTPQPSAVDIEDVVLRSDCACPPSIANKCSNIKTTNAPCPYLDNLDQAANTLGLTPLEQSSGNGGQLLKHSVLILAYTASMFVEIGFTAWTIVLDEVTGIYVELEFLDITVTYGQSLILWVLFGLDPDEIFNPIVRLLKKLWYGPDTLKLIPIEDLSFETKHVCEQFMTHHLERCRQAIAKDARWRMKTYHGVFPGSCLVNWLIDCGLAKDEAEAVQYGRHLVEGRLVAHINNAYHFRNSLLLYSFV